MTNKDERDVGSEAPGGFAGIGSRLRDQGAEVLMKSLICLLLSKVTEIIS